MVSGHSQTIEDADGTKLGYLVPVDAPDPDKDLFGFMERAVSMRQIETVSKQIMSKHVLMLFDSCFSGAIFQMVRAKPSPYIQEKVSYPVRQFITAGTENEQVPDKSVFKLDKKTAPKSSLNVNTNPNDAKVRILNIGQKFYQGIELKSGRYHVEVSADEYETKKLWVTLGSGEDKSIDVRLKKRAVAASSSYSSYSSAREIKRDGRFVAYANGTVKDTKTGLMWASKDNGEDIKWEDAKRYCENYRVGGYTDWRMPTLDELKGLYDKSESYQPTQTTYMTKLIELSSCCPWTSETRGSGAAFFNFYDGSSYWIPQSISNHVRRVLPVRSGK
jgi:hypothetical protein